MFRKFELLIESVEDEKENLQRFLMEVYRLSVACFPSLSLDIMKEKSK